MSKGIFDLIEEVAMEHTITANGLKVFTEQDVNFIKKSIDTVFNKYKRESIDIIYQNKIDSKDNYFKSKVGGTPFVSVGFSIPTNDKKEQMTMMYQINCKELPPNNIYPSSGIIQFWADFDIKNMEAMSLGMDEATTVVTYQPNLTNYVNVDAVFEKYNPVRKDDGWFRYGKDNSKALGFKKSVSYPCLYGKIEDDFLAIFNKEYNTNYEYFYDIFHGVKSSNIKPFKYQGKLERVGLFNFWKYGEINKRNQEAIAKARDEYNAEKNSASKAYEEIWRHMNSKYSSDDRIGGYIDSTTLNDAALDDIYENRSTEVVLFLYPNTEEQEDKDAAIDFDGSGVYEYFWYVNNKNDLPKGNIIYTSTYFH